MLELILLSWRYIIRPALHRYRTKLVSGCLLFVCFMYIGQSNAWFRLPFQTLDIYEAFSDKTPLLLEFSAYQNMWNGVDTQMQQDLHRIAALQQLDQDLAQFDTCFGGVQQTNYLQNKRVVAGLFLLSKDKLGWLMVLDAQDQTSKKAALSQFGLANNYYTTQYRGLEVHHVEFKQGEKWTIAWYGQLILAATNAFVVESAIKQLDDIEGNLALNKTFLDCQIPTRQKSLFTFYINYQTVASLATIINDSKKTALGDLAALGTWSSYELREIEKGWMINGRMQPLKENRFLNAMLGQRARQKTDLGQYIPSNFAFMMYWSWDNFQSFNQQLGGLQGSDFDQYIRPWMGQDMALVIKDPVDDQHAFAKDMLLLVHCEDTVEARIQLERLGLEKGLLGRFSYQNHEILQLASLHTFRPLLGATLNPLQNPYCTFIDHYIVFSNAKTTLEGWIKNYNTQQLAIYQQEFKPFFKQMSNASNMYALVNSPNAYKLLDHFYRPSMKANSLQLFEGLKKIYPIGIQWHALGNDFAISLSANHHKRASENNQNTALITWESDLLAPAIIAPQVLRVRQSTACILVQDSLKRLYFFDKNGDNLWPSDRVLNEAINSKVYEIDFYDNGDIQYAFSTAYHIYVIDAKGQEIKKIPLISRAVNGLLVKNSGKGPLFYIACNNGMVYGYNQFGKPLSGWRPLEANGRIPYTLKHMSFNQKKYFMGLNQGGQLQAFDPKGALIFSAAQPIERVNNWGLDPTIGRVAVGTDLGTVKIFNSKGQHFSFKPIETMRPPIDFLYTDLVGDRRKDYIRISDSLMYIHYYQKDAKGSDKIQKKGPLSIPFSKNKSVFEVAVDGNGNKMIGLLDLDNHSVALIDKNGQMQPGFPLPGTTKFTLSDLFEEHAATLVVANHQKVYACKLKVSF